MNKRNWQVFGPSKTTRVGILALVILIILIITAWLWMSNDSPTAAVINQPSNQLTGAAAQQQQQEQEAQQQTEQQERIVEEAPEEPQRQYYTYEGQCAFDLKQRQDDVAETTNVVNDYQKEIDALNAEYESRKKELEEKYIRPLDILRPKLEKAQQELDAAKERYDKLQTSCNLQQPQ